jgi:hypothetical protein
LDKKNQNNNNTRTSTSEGFANLMAADVTGYNGPIESDENKYQAVSTFQGEWNTQGLNSPRGYSKNDYII